MRTTRETAKEESHNKLVHNLQELLEQNYDAEDDYKKALKKIKDPNLKNFLKLKAVQHNHYSTEIEKLLRSLNERPKERGSTKNVFFRAWMDIKSALHLDEDEAVLEECIRGEKAAKKEYEEKLKKDKFPPQIEEVLQKQLTEIKATVAEIETLEDLEE